MTDTVFYTPGGSAALSYAKEKLIAAGIPFAEAPDATVTHLLLGVPAFQEDGRLKGGICTDTVLPYINADTVVIGGNLCNPALSGFQTIDLLQDPFYLAQNADITAYCAVRIAMQRLSVTLKDCPVLIVGWGRIGKCLSQLLRAMGAAVTIAARKDTDRAICKALGYEVEDLTEVKDRLPLFRVIFNTVPHPVLSGDALAFCQEDCLKIDLASSPGMEGSDIIVARGLPGKDAPESSGQLIAQTILRLL